MKSLILFSAGVYVGIKVHQRKEAVKKTIAAVSLAVWAKLD